MKSPNFTGAMNLCSSPQPFSSKELHTLLGRMNACLRVFEHAKDRKSPEQVVGALLSLFDPVVRDDIRESSTPALLHFGPYDGMLSKKAIEVVALVLSLEHLFSSSEPEWLPQPLRQALDDALFPHLLYAIDKFTTQELSPLDLPPPEVIRFPISKWVPWARDLTSSDLQIEGAYLKALEGTRNAWELSNYISPFSVTKAILIPETGSAITYDLFQERRILLIARQSPADTIVIDWNTPLRSDAPNRGSSRRPFDLRYFTCGKEIDLTAKTISNALNRAVVWKLVRIIDSHLRAKKDAEINRIKINKDDVSNPRILFMASQLRKIFQEIGAGQAMDILPMNRKTGTLEICFNAPILLIGKPPSTFHERRRVEPRRRNRFQNLR